MTTTILFLCPHHAAKSVIAEAYFNRLAQQYGLPVQGDSAGTEPDETVAPRVVEMLRQENIDVSGHQPRLVTETDLAQAQRIISMGCTPEELGIPSERIEQWVDIPPVSQDPSGARNAILTHVENLVAELRDKERNTAGGVTNDES
jgi:arsenate reductase (thioredoxin)